MKEFRNRHKAWIGAAIGAATSLIGMALNGAAQKKQQREIERQENYKSAIDRIAAMNNAYANQDYVNDFEDRVIYRLGGRKFMNPRKRGNDNRLVADQTSNQFSNVPIFRNRIQKLKCGGRR